MHGLHIAFHTIRIHRDACSRVDSVKSLSLDRFKGQFYSQVVIGVDSTPISMLTWCQQRSWSICFSLLVSSSLCACFFAQVASCFSRYSKPKETQDRVLAWWGKMFGDRFKVQLFSLVVIVIASTSISMLTWSQLGSWGLCLSLAGLILFACLLLVLLCSLFVVGRFFVPSLLSVVSI